MGATSWSGLLAQQLFNKRSCIIHQLSVLTVTHHVAVLRTCVDARMCWTFLFQLKHVISGAAAAPGAPDAAPCMQQKKQREIQRE